MHGKIVVTEGVLPWFTQESGISSGDTGAGLRVGGTETFLLSRTLSSPCQVAEGVRKDIDVGEHNNVASLTLSNPPK